LKIGIISDTHDDIANVQRAIKIFNTENVEYVIHAGDYIFPGVVLEFKKLNAKLVGVFGNNDGERIHLLKNFLEIGAELKGEIGEIELDELLFGIYHGTDKNIKERLVNSQNYDVFISGHTHKIELSAFSNTTNNTEQKANRINTNQKRGSTLVLNPGTAHKKVESESGAFEEGGVIIFNTHNKQYKLVDLP
jgi:putative phosphoesterase